MAASTHRPEPTFQPPEDVIVIDSIIQKPATYEEFTEGLGADSSSTLLTTVEYTETDISFITTPEPEDNAIPLDLSCPSCPVKKEQAEGGSPTPPRWSPVTPPPRSPSLSPTGSSILIIDISDDEGDADRAETPLSQASAESFGPVPRLSLPKPASMKV